MKIWPIDAVRSQRMFNTKPVAIAAYRHMQELGLEGPFRIHVTYGPPGTGGPASRPYLYIASPDWQAVYAFRAKDIDASTFGFDPPEEGYELTLPMEDFFPMWDDWRKMPRRKRVASAKRMWTEQSHGTAMAMGDRIEQSLVDTMRRQGWSIVWDADHRPITNGERQLLVGAISHAVGRK